MIVHVTFLKIGEIDTKKECFDADVLITAKWREAELDRETEITEVMRKTEIYYKRNTICYLLLITI